MICFPNAKINLGLLVKEKRHDDMHNIETCLVPVPLFDILELLPSSNFSLNLMGLPIYGNPEENIIVKAWDLITSVRKDIPPVKVYIYKTIPPGSGLGGGSSNAAFFLMALNNYFSLGLSATDLELLTAKIGVDCPFFINNMTTIATGIGNEFSACDNPVSGMRITIVFPKIHISTKEAYSKIVPVRKSSITDVLNSDRSAWKSELKNDFEEIIFSDFPELNEIKRLLYNSGADYASLTGSGSAVYALSEKPINLRRLNERYKVWSGILS